MSHDHLQSDQRLANPERAEAEITAAPDDIAARIDVERLAILVANGTVPILPYLTHEQSERLITDVRRLRRRRLVKHVARCIALDINSEPDPGREHATDAET